MNFPAVYVKFQKEQLAVQPLTPAAVGQLQNIAFQLQSGACPLEEIFESLGALLTTSVRDRLFPDYQNACCDQFVCLWIAACDAVLYQQRQRQKQYLRKLRAGTGHG